MPTEPEASVPLTDKEDAARAKTLLKSLEWRGEQIEHHAGVWCRTCPECEQMECVGHAYGCELGDYLKESFERALREKG